MNVNSVNTVPSVKKAKKSHPARVGATLTAGVLATSTATSWIMRPDEMHKVVQECGGRNNYIKTFLLGGSILMVMGAVTSSAISGIAKLVTPKKSPKAVN